MKNRLIYLILTCTTCLIFSSKAFAQCSGNEPVVFLGNDTILCQGQSLNLTAPNGYDVYSWSTGATNTGINVNSAGTYSVETILFSGNDNLVVNGNFEAGNTGFTSSYDFVANPDPQALWDPSTYAVGQSPNDFHSNFSFCIDKTTGTGMMYIANGASSPNTIIWTQTIAVDPNTNYNFSAWASSVENTSDPAVLQFFVNGTQIGNVFSPSTTGCTWGEFFNLWNSGTSTSAVISIVNQNTEPSGNDFALDDISFVPYCTNTDAIQVTYETISVDAGQDLSFCSDFPESLSASSNVANATFLWNTNETTNTIVPTLSTNYSVTATSTNGCSASDNVNVQIKQSLDAEFSSSSTAVLVPFTTNFENSSSQNATYSWYINDSLMLTTVNYADFIHTFTSAGDYSIKLLVSSINGCSDSMNLTITANDVEFLETANVFTPDADGINDFYQFNMENIKTLSLTIFNRWGQEIKQISTISENWDGTDVKGDNVSPGIYFYTFQATSATENELKGQGFIHLIR
ncbi:MAG: gliding motility-associated C-terminal domain-containing protein [Bacteroidota bacterium]